MSALRGRYTATLSFLFKTLRDCNSTFLANSWEQYYLDWIVRQRQKIDSGNLHNEPQAVIIYNTQRSYEDFHRWTLKDLWPLMPTSNSTVEDSLSFCMVQYDIRSKHTCFLNNKSPWKHLLESVTDKVLKGLCELENTVRSFWLLMHKCVKIQISLHNKTVTNTDILRMQTVGSEKVFVKSITTMKFATIPPENLQPFSQLLFHFYQEFLQVLDELV